MKGDGENICAKIQITLFIVRVCQVRLCRFSPSLKRLVSIYKLVAVESMQDPLLFTLCNILENYLNA